MIVFQCHINCIESSIKCSSFSKLPSYHYHFEPLQTYPRQCRPLPQLPLVVNVTWVALSITVSVLSMAISKLSGGRLDCLSAGCRRVAFLRRWPDELRSIVSGAAVKCRAGNRQQQRRRRRRRGAGSGDASSPIRRRHQAGQ